MQSFEPFKPILDRILLKLVHDDGPQDGFEVPEKYRQHTNKGEVLAVGDCVVLSGHKMDITDFVNVGDHVLFGEYTAEEFTSDELKAQYGDVDKFYIIRVQDVRGKAAKKSDAGQPGELGSPISCAGVLDQVVSVVPERNLLTVNNSNVFLVGQIVRIYSHDMHIFRGVAVIKQIPKQDELSDVPMLYFIELPPGVIAGDLLTIESVKA